MFRKLVMIGPVGLEPWAEVELNKYAHRIVRYDDIPADAAQIVSRIGDADAVLLSYTSSLSADLLAQCPEIKYIGMCCSLYSPASANVDITYATQQGITVTGIRDYGDEGVVEYVISELVRRLHGFGTDGHGEPIVPWEGTPREITGLKVGIVGLGKLGGMIADALSFFGAHITYFSRSEKSEAKAKGYRFRNLDDLLAENEVVVSCLNKNTVLIFEDQFKRMGNNKILFNVGLSPAWDKVAFDAWIERNNLAYCDSAGALGNDALLAHPNVHCMGVSSGRTRQAFGRLSQKVLANIEEYLKMQSVK